LACVSPPDRFSSPKAITTNKPVVPISTRVGRAATRSPIRRHAPCVESVPASPTWGT
jgi:hypothetical protein